MIKILLVDDSDIALTILTRLLSSDPDIEIVGTAKNGGDALALIPKVKPDIVCTDYYMPGMDGLELTKRIVARYQLPILVVSGVLDKKNSSKIFALIEAGALDILEKPLVYSTKDDPSVQKLIQTIHQLMARSRKPFYNLSIKPKTLNQEIQPEEYRIIGIGASTGGPAAIKTIIKNFPSTFQIPIICVQHMSHGFLEGFIEWLQIEVQLKVKIMENNDLLQGGYIYFPQEDTHLEVFDKDRLIATTKRAAQHHRPSIDVSLTSIAHHYQAATIGVLLTGMGSDGAKGMEAIAQAGGMTIVQDQQSCIVSSMPEETIKLNAAQLILPLEEIGPHLLKIVNRISIHKLKKKDDK
ncbi:MAG: chemotaxis protein CheB [Chlamydiales bacterium]